MDSTSLNTHLHAEYARLSAVLAEADSAATVPTCPDWSVDDLAWHITNVYLHKAESMRLGAEPDPWPPLRGSVTLAGAWSALVDEFAKRMPSDETPTWFPPDQTVAFWIRRMAQETVIHRVDVQLAAGVPVTPIATDLALDGVDEALRIFLADASVRCHDEFADVLATADRRGVWLTTGDQGWLVAAAPEGVTVTEASLAPEAGARVSGTAGALVRWVWNRGGEGVTVEGDGALVEQLQSLVVIATQ